MHRPIPSLVAAAPPVLAVARNAVLAVLACVVLLAPAGAGAAGAATAVSSSEPRVGGTAIIGADFEPLCLNVFRSACNQSWATWTAGIALAGAFRLTPSLTYEPVLVDSVDVQTAPFALTYHIKPAAVWSDGTPVSADDFIFTRNVLVDPANEIVSRTGYELITQVQRIDDKQVKFAFSKPYVAWKTLFPSVLPRHVLQGADFDQVWQREIADPATDEPIGSGPFLVTGWQAGESITLERNPNWWGPQAPFLDGIVVEFIPDSNQLFQAMAARRVDLINPPPTLQIQDLRNTPGVVVESGPGLTLEHLDVNVGSGTMPLLGQKWFRQALAHALDRAALPPLLFGSLDPMLGVQQSLVYPSTHPDYEPSFARYAYDVDAVATLMTSHGCAKGGDGIWSCGGVRASVKLATTTGNQLRAMAQQELQAKAAAAGIELVPDNSTAGVLFGQRLPARDYELIMFAWVRDSDPAGLVDLYGCAGAQNFMAYCSATATDFLSMADTEPDAAARAALVNNADGILAEDAPSLPFFLRPAFLAYNALLHGPANNPTTEGPTWNVEDWWLEPTFTVDSTVDAVDATPGDGLCQTGAGECTLRAAIQEANAKAGRDEILLPAGTYQLALAGRGEDQSATGDLDVRDDLVVAGAGALSTTIDANSLDRVLDVYAPGSTIEVQLRGVALTDGNGDPGGAVRTTEELTLASVFVHGNRTDLDGGAIANEAGVLRLVDSTVVENATTAAYGTTYGDGGGIFNGASASLVVEGSIVDHNTAENDGAGIYNRAEGGARGSVEITESSVSGNFMRGCGEAAGVYNAGDLVIAASFLERNVSNCEAGAIRNTATGVLSVEDTTITGNVADDGAGVYNSGTATIRRTVIDGNDAFFAYGGGILNGGSLTVENTTLTLNHAAHRGGGIYASSGSASLRNVTVAANEAINPGGVNPFPVLAAAGGGMYNDGATVTLKNTILARNGAVTSSAVSNCAGGAPVSLGYNLEDAATCGLAGTGDRDGTDPQLGAFGDHGGPTWTIPLAAASPAVDAGTNDGCPATDQRGEPRPTDGDGNGSAVCDIGAYEASTKQGGGGAGGGGGGGGGGGVTPTDLALAGSASPSAIAVGETVTFLLTARDVHPAWGATGVKISYALPAGAVLVGATTTRGPGCSAGSAVVCGLDFMLPSTSAEAVLTVRFTAAGTLTNTFSVSSTEADIAPSDNSLTLTVTVAGGPPPPNPPPPGGGLRLTGTRGPDTLRGTRGADVLRGLGGDDRLYGLAGNDLVDGGRGRDLLVGGGGRDRLLGGPGNDRILAADGVADVIRCGRGRDQVTADRADQVFGDCEVVRRR